jgi:serine/threonine-protein kinase HipA
MGDLIVALHGVTIGRLSGTSSNFDFVAEPTAVDIFGLDSSVLSLAIPLSVVPTRAHRQRRQNFFRELLPEGRTLTRMAQDADLQDTDVLGLLRRYGRDVAGALQIWDPDEPGEPRHPATEPLTEAQVAAMLDAVREHPLGNRPPGGKSSLAGVQDKIVLAREGRGWARVLDGWPSTHILKPEARDHATTTYDEEYGARLARALGLTTFASTIEEFAGVPALVIERYDRSEEAAEGRIHQEDFNQVLGAAGIQKYQRYSGKVSFSRIAAVVARLRDGDGLTRLLRLVVLSVAVGNLDLHAKNISVLHHGDGSMTLAPAYDLVPQAHLSNDGEMALAVGGEFRHAALTRSHLISEGTDWGGAFRRRGRRRSAGARIRAGGDRPAR